MARGYRTDQASSDRWLSPDGPYTGDGNTRRSMASGLQAETRTADGTKMKAKKAPGKSQAEKDKEAREHLERLSRKTRGKRNKK